MKWLMRMVGKTKKRHGFTLIELMVVLIIIGILAVAAVPTYMYFVHRAYSAEAAASLGAIKTAEIVFKAEHGAFSAIWGSGPGGMGMTSADFASNKWFHYGCFSLAAVTTDAFTAWCDGGWTGAGLADPRVNDICVWLTNTSDVTNATAGGSAGTRLQ